MPYLALLILLLLGNMPALIMAYLFRKRFQKLKFMAYGWMILFSTLQISFFIDEVSGWKKKRLFEQIQKDFSVQFQALDEERQLFCMALVAEKMKEEYVIPSKKEDIKVFLKEFIPKMNHQIASDSSQWENNALYLSQMCIIFSAYHEIIPTDTIYQGLHRQMVHFLYREMNTSPNHQILSYPTIPQPWLCDNAGVLYALALYDTQYATRLHHELFEEWKGTINSHFIDAKVGLPCTQVQDNSCIVQTRGSSTAWLIAYLALLSKQDGQKTWALYKKHFKFSFAGIGAGFYEYVDDTKTEDYDSGTIVLGLGTVASGLAIRAARKNEDWLTYFQLINTFRIVSLGSFIFPELGNDVLTNSILYNATY